MKKTNENEKEQELSLFDPATLFMQCVGKVYRPESEGIYVDAVYKTTADLLVEFSSMCEVGLLDASKALTEAKYTVEDIGGRAYWKLWRAESSIY